MYQILSVISISLVIFTRYVHSYQQCSLFDIPKYCPNYCCSGGSFDTKYCCDDCMSSVDLRQCPTFNNIIKGSIAGVVLLCAVISIISCICCGCMCSSRTGIQRRGWIISQPQTNVTMISTTVPTLTNPAPGTAYIVNQEYPASSNLPPMYTPYPGYPSSIQAHNSAYESD